VRIYPVFLFIIIVFALPTLAQTSSEKLSEDDIDEIKYLSEGFIEEFEQLLNLIADPSLGEYKRKQITQNSFNPNSGNKIFVDDEVIIEDDIDPTYFEHNERIKDSPVGKYLNDLDLFYEKSSEPTISFTDVETFNVDKNAYVYSVVYFKSFFRSQHRTIRRPYRQTERIATIKADKKGNVWNLSIVSIVFYNPEDERHENKINPDISKIPLELSTNIFSPSQTDSTINLFWKSRINNVYPLTYNLYEGSMLLGKTRDSSYTVTNLEAEKEYSFYLTAVEDSTARISNASEIEKVKTKEAPKPLPVKSFTFKNIQSVYKKGFPYRIEWENSSDSVRARLEIFDANGNFLDVIEQSQLRKYTEWEANYLYKAGDGYQFVLSDPKDRTNIAYSDKFKIVRKVPLFLKIAPILVVGAVVGVVAGGGGGG